MGNNGNSDGGMGRIFDTVYPFLHSMTCHVVTFCAISAGTLCDTFCGIVFSLAVPLTGARPCGPGDHSPPLPPPPDSPGAEEASDVGDQCGEGSGSMNSKPPDDPNPVDPASSSSSHAAASAKPSVPPGGTPFPTGFKELKLSSLDSIFCCP